MKSPGPGALTDVLDRVRELDSGEVATYIPQLALADPEKLGIAVVSTRGRIYEAGDSGVPFTIQSVSKPFVYALALRARGIDEVLTHVDVEPSGEPFNAISLDADSGRPRNPMINAGAIVVAALVEGATAADKSASINTYYDYRESRKTNYRYSYGRATSTNSGTRVS